MSHPVRAARLSDLPLLQQIERDASQLFKETPYSFIAQGESLPIEVLEEGLRQQRLWIAVDEFDRPVGFAIASIVDDTAYIQEIDVNPTHMRQGIGRQLVENACNWAKENNYSNIYLSTFTDLPWNAPFYAKIGFEVVHESKLTVGYKQIRQKEADAGFPMENRVIMRREL